MKLNIVYIAGAVLFFQSSIQTRIVEENLSGLTDLDWNPGRHSIAFCLMAKFATL